MVFAGALGVEAEVERILPAELEAGFRERVVAGLRAPITFVYARMNSNPRPKYVYLTKRAGISVAQKSNHGYFLSPHAA